VEGKSRNRQSGQLPLALATVPQNLRLSRELVESTVEPGIMDRKTQASWLPLAARDTVFAMFWKASLFTTVQSNHWKQHHDFIMMCLHLPSETGIEMLVGTRACEFMSNVYTHTHTHTHANLPALGYINIYDGYI
jgi:hypothetical protein